MESGSTGMFIGKIVQQGETFGYVHQLGSQKEKDVYFTSDAIIKHSRLSRSLKTYRAVGAFIVYDIFSDKKMAGYKVAKVTCLAEEITDDEMFAWLDADFAKEPETIDYLRSVYPVQYDDFIHRITAQQTERRSECKSQTVSNMINETKWHSLTREQKVRTILDSSGEIETVRNYYEAIDRVALKIENSSGDDLVSALLYFLLSICQSEEAKRKEYIQRGDRMLCTAIAKDYAGGEDASIYNCILPTCISPYSPSAFCDAHFVNSKKYVPYIACGKHDAVWNVECRGSKVNQTVDVFLTTPHKNAVDKLFAKRDLRDLLFAIKFHLTDLRETINENYSDAEYPYILGGYANRIKGCKEYLHCRCGAIMTPDYSEKIYSNVFMLTMFTCIKAKIEPNQHDEHVYVNYCDCCNSSSNKKYWIDSRECHHQEDEYLHNNGKKWLCMRCGGTENIGAGKYCPSCGNTGSAIEYDRNQKIVKCSCGHDGSYFGVRPCSNKYKPLLLTEKDKLEQIEEYYKALDEQSEIDIDELFPDYTSFESDVARGEGFLLDDDDNWIPDDDEDSFI